MYVFFDKRGKKIDKYNNILENVSNIIKKKLIGNLYIIKDMKKL